MDAAKEKSEATESRTVFFIGDVDEAAVKNCMEKLVTLAESDITKPITLVISSLGGDVYDAIGLYDLMKFVQAPIHTVGFGKIMSAGVLLLAAGAHGHRSMGRNAMIMYHPGHDRISGTVWQAENSLQEFKRQERQYDQLVALECGRTLEEVQAIYCNRMDNYIDAPAALQFGLIDKLI